MLHFSSDFHKNRFTRSQVCRAPLIKSVLETSDSGASNTRSNVEIRPPEAVVITFEVFELLQNLKKTHKLFPNIWNFNLFKCDQIILKCRISAADHRRAKINTFQSTLNQRRATRLRACTDKCRQTVAFATAIFLDELFSRPTQSPLFLPVFFPITFCRKRTLWLFFFQILIRFKEVGS